MSKRSSAEGSANPFRAEAYLSSLQPRDQQLPLENQFLWQIGIELKEELILHQHFALPLLDVE